MVTLEKQCYPAPIDPSDAYLYMPIGAQHRKYLLFIQGWRHNQYWALPWLSSCLQSFLSYWCMPQTIGYLSMPLPLQIWVCSWYPDSCLQWFVVNLVVAVAWVCCQPNQEFPCSSATAGACRIRPQHLRPPRVPHRPRSWGLLQWSNSWRGCNCCSSMHLLGNDDLLLGNQDRKNIPHPKNREHRGWR